MSSKHRTERLPEDAHRLTGDTYVVPGLTNSGYIHGLMIDTGPEFGTHSGVDVDTLVITHGHADHFACAADVRDRGAKVYASRDDASLVENPEVNIRGMFSWAKPSDELVTKLFKGMPCEVDALVETLDDERVTVVPLPGHTLGHTGYLTADGVIFTGDTLYLEALWAKHRLPYTIDPSLVVKSLDLIARMDFEWLVPGHGRAVEHDEALKNIDFHLGQLREIEDLLVDRLKTEHTTEEAIALVSAARGLGDNAAQYWLAVTTVKGFLGSLMEQERMEFFVRGHAGWWKTV